MAGTYPAATDVEAWFNENWASQPDSTPIQVFAYAAAHGALPDSVETMRSFYNYVQGISVNGNYPGLAPSYLYDYVQSHGSVPSGGQLYTWMLQEGFLTTQGLTGFTPAAGAHYPPGGRSAALPSASSTTVVPPPSLLDQLGLGAMGGGTSPLLLIAGGVIGSILLRKVFKV